MTRAERTWDRAMQDAQDRSGNSACAIRCNTYAIAQGVCACARVAVQIIETQTNTDARLRSGVPV